MAELKPCKKCNHTDWLYVYKDHYDKKFYVLCQNCRTFAGGDTEEQAISAWNKRS